MDYEKLAESVRLCGSTPKADQCKQCAYWSGGDMSKCIPRMTTDAATALSTLQAENEKLRTAADNWEKKYVDTNNKWIEAENKWDGLDKAVRNGSVYRPIQEELNLTHEENQSLKDVNEKLRAELERVKQERDEAVQCIRGIAKSGRVWMCPYCVHAKDTTGGIAECELDVGVCMMPYSKFEWRGQKEA